MARPATAAVRLLTGEREPCRLATTANVDVDTGGLLVIDGVQTVVGDRVLVKNQTDGSENGIRTVSAGQWYRAADARTPRTMQKGTTVHVAEGSTNAGKTYVFNTLNPVIGDTAISIVFYQSDDTIGVVNAAVAAGIVSIGAAGDAEILVVQAAGAPIVAAAQSARDEAIAAAAGANGTIPVVDRTAAKAISPTTKKAVIIYGEAGRNGTFVVKAGTPPVSDPQEGVYLVINGSYYLERVYAPRVAFNIEWFGAANGATATANTTAIQACLAIADAVFIPSAGYAINGTLSVTRRGQRIFGNGLKSVISQTANDTDVLVLANGVVADVRLEDFYITGASASFTTGGIGVRSEYAGNLVFRNVTVASMFVGFYVDTRTNVATSNVWLERCSAYACKSTGIEIFNATGVYVSDSYALTCLGTGIRITDGSAVHLRNCLSNSNALHGVQVRVVNATNTDWHFFDQVECDGNTLDGFRLSNTRGLQANNCWAGTNDGQGWNFLASVTHFLGSNCIGRNNGNHGFACGGLADSALSNCAADGNKRLGSSGLESGFFFPTGATNVTLANCLAVENLITARQAYGFNIAGTASGIQVNGGQSSGNVTAQVGNSSSGLNNRIRNVLGYKTKATGTGTMNSGTGSIAVTHGLATTPTRVLVTPTSDPGAVRFSVTTKGTTTFTVAANTTTGLNAFTFDWEAVVGDE